MKQSHVKVLIIGSGAAGLNAALQVYKKGICDVLILTEGLDKGTSINTGSDKQTYYKLSMCGDQLDSPEKMAQSYLAGGSMHGDLALVESALSARAFHHLVELGLPFPQDAYGQFVGYKTDHDPLQRATSIGPYTSREMCIALQRAVAKTNIQIRENCEVIELVVDEKKGHKQIKGAFFLNQEDELEYIFSTYMIFAVGGPGGLYADSVYPSVHNGAIGLALMAGAKARNLPESQFGLASIKVRWNVSGTYMQVLPRVISVDENGNEEEFLIQHFSSPNECYSQLFLKGYQWPFDVTKAQNGSSRIDLLIDAERKEKHRRVFLDYSSNPIGLDYKQLSTEAYQYLAHSDALFGTPFDRLLKMNPHAVDLYRNFGVELGTEILEVAVCAQHNNGGLAADHWWESENIKNFFPVGEVNGSHGVKRPGGSALNAGQVGGFRIADKIAYLDSQQDSEDHPHDITESTQQLADWEKSCGSALLSWQEILQTVRTLMSSVGGFKRDMSALESGYKELNALWHQVNQSGMQYNPSERKELYRTRQLLFASYCYLSAIQFMVNSGVGSRGSSLVLKESLSGKKKVVPEDNSYRNSVLETMYADGEPQHGWLKCHSLPQLDHWFERDWSRYRDGEIFE